MRENHRVVNLVGESHQEKLATQYQQESKLVQHADVLAYLLLVVVAVGCVVWAYSVKP